VAGAAARFFGSENDARRAARDGVFPNAVIGIATVEEQDAAAGERRLQASAHTATPGRLRGRARALPELTPERIEALVAEANGDAAESYDRSIQIYTRLPRSWASAVGARRASGSGSRAAQGSVAQARHEYGEYLAEFPRADAERVNGSRGCSRPPPRHVSESNRSPPTDLGLPGGVAQYYRRDVYRPLDQLPVETLQSAFVSNVTSRAASRRASTGGRRPVSLQPDRRDDAPRARSADQLYLTNAYVNVADAARLVGGSAASRRRGGVLGRSTARAEYQRPQIGLNSHWAVLSPTRATPSTITASSSRSARTWTSS
jgi:hypothetical protein